MDIINNETPDPNLIPLIIDESHLIRTGFKELYNELLDTTIYNCYLDTATNELVFQRDKSNLRFDFSLSGLADVNTSNATAGQVLTYSGSDWVAQDVNSVLSFTGPQSSRFSDITGVTSITDALTKILYPYQPPNFSSFQISGKSGQFELGQWFSTSSGGNETFSWTIGGLIANVSDTYGYTIQDVTTPQTLITGLVPKTTISSILPVVPITKTSIASHTFRITGRNTQGTNFTREFSHSWYPKVYYGNSPNTTLTTSEILGLQSSYLASNLLMNVNITGGGNYLWIAQPKNFGPAIGADFSNPRFEVFNLPNSAWYRSEVSHTNAYGYTQDYYIYRSKFVQNGIVPVKIK